MSFNKTSYLYSLNEVGYSSGYGYAIANCNDQQTQGHPVSR